jgi:hypothetical protein
MSSSSSRYCKVRVATGCTAQEAGDRRAQKPENDSHNLGTPPYVTMVGRELACWTCPNGTQVDDVKSTSGLPVYVHDVGPMHPFSSLGRGEVPAQAPLKAPLLSLSVSCHVCVVTSPPPPARPHPLPLYPARRRPGSTRPEEPSPAAAAPHNSSAAPPLTPSPLPH